MEELEARHRKEKKDLQKQITKLKHEAKANKKKTKEIDCQIDRLELDLRARQEREILELQCASELKQESISNIRPLDEQKKPSKAAKRREAKEEAAKKRTQDMEEARLLAFDEPKAIEQRRIDEKLSRLNLQIYEVNADGHCLFSAVAHQYKCRTGEKATMAEMRRRCAEYMREHPDDFKPFMAADGNFDVDLDHDDEYQRYCDQVATADTETPLWGGQLEMRALSQALQAPITLIQDAQEIHFEPEMRRIDVPLFITYHRKIYTLGEHYNSTIGKQAESDDNV